MNERTYQKLKNNPHYKISAKNLAELEDREETKKEPMVAFGKLPLHNDPIPFHPTGPKRKIDNAKKK